jgi:glycosyltransferase involved in cell wall biosynthesis
MSGDPWIHRHYLSRSLGEWSVAKNAYVAGRSGWFSCRTACYLALGVPAIVQDTGFGRAIPTGEGVLTFSTLEEATDAIERLASDPNRHARAAWEIAEEYFDSDKVLTRLIDEAQGR